MQKKGTNCRFNYPRPPSFETVISKPTELGSPQEVNIALQNSAAIKETRK